MSILDLLDRDEFDPNAASEDAFLTRADRGTTVPPLDYCPWCGDLFRSTGHQHYASCPSIVGVPDFTIHVPF